VEAALKMSDIYVRLGRNQDAMKVLEDALEIDPENADLLKELALLYETMGYPYWGKTIRTYRNILSIDHGNAEAYRKLGEFYYTVIKDYESALDCFQQSLKIAPDQEGYEQIKIAIQKLQSYVKLNLGDDPESDHIAVR